MFFPTKDVGIKNLGTSVQKKVFYVSRKFIVFVMISLEEEKRAFKYLDSFSCLRNLVVSQVFIKVPKGLSCWVVWGVIVLITTMPGEILKKGSIEDKLPCFGISKESGSTKGICLVQLSSANSLKSFLLVWFSSFYSKNYLRSSFSEKPRWVRPQSMAGQPYKQGLLQVLLSWILPF